MEASVNKGSPQGSGHGSSSAGKSSLEKTLLEFTINPTIEPVEPRAGEKLSPNNYQGGSPTPLFSR